MEMYYEIDHSVATLATNAKSEKVVCASWIFFGLEVRRSQEKCLEQIGRHENRGAESSYLRDEKPAS
jgi:hypothetical protein